MFMSVYTIHPVCFMFIELLNNLSLPFPQSYGFHCILMSAINLSVNQHVFPLPVNLSVCLSQKGALFLIRTGRLSRGTVDCSLRERTERYF